MEIGHFVSQFFLSLSRVEVTVSWKRWSSRLLSLLMELYGSGSRQGMLFASLFTQLNYTVWQGQSLVQKSYQSPEVHFHMALLLSE